MKSFPTIALSFLLTVIFTQCETTGDPNEGGYFGYSAEKNQIRQAGLRDELGIYQEEGRGLESERSRLQGQRSTVQRQIANKKAQLARLEQQRRAQASSNRATPTAVDSEISALRSEIGVLETRLIDLQ